MDYKNPDYTQIFIKRAERLAKLKADPKLLAACKIHYQSHPWDFINDWGMTFEPRNIELGLLTSIPFILWPKQREYLEWIYTRWRKRERGLVEKSRDCGVTWLSVGYACVNWLFVEGFSAGFGSRKEDLVDKKGDPDCIFEKIRHFIDNIPSIFIPKKFTEREHSSYMRLINPDNGATITGESGDNIGRGGRKSIYFVDEAAFVEHQDLVDKALSNTTNCQIDISTPNGNGNAFYKKRERFNNTPQLFIFDWRDDPRKDQAWYDKMCNEHDEVTVAQEIDRDYNASQEDMFIPAKWVKSAIDAHLLLGFPPQGIRVTGFDPADTGDAKAIVNRHGSVIMEADQITSGDITYAVPWAITAADNFRADIFAYDGDGMGAPVMKMAKGQTANRMKVWAYRGSAGVVESGATGRKMRRDHREGKTALSDLEKSNADTYENFRAQSWTWVRWRFEATHNAVERIKAGHIVNCGTEELISISSQCSHLHALVAELSRPKRVFTSNGKIKVEAKDKMKARGVESPNLAEACIISMSAPANILEEPKRQYQTDTWSQSVPGVI